MVRLRIFWKSVIGMLAFLLVIQAHAQQKQRKIEQLLYQYHRNHDFEGVVLVGEKGEVIYQKSFGFANRTWGIPNSIDTKFFIASVSKQFTATIILQLIEEGRLDLEGFVSEYLPYYRKDIGSEVNLHHLLTHTSGIPNFTSMPGVWEDSLRLHYTTKEMVKKFCSRDLEFEPGSTYRYNNSGYLLLAAIVESVTGNDFGYELRKRILEPLQMDDSGVGVEDNIIPELASGYTQENNAYLRANYTYMRNLVGAASMYSTASDLMKWDRALYTNQLLSQQSLERMMTSFTYDNSWIVPYENGYGYGLGMANVARDQAKDTVNMVYHSGHISGYSCFFARFVDQEQVVIILSNIDDISTTGMNAIAIGIHDIISTTKVPVYGE